MPHINRIRVNNVRYNFGTQFYDDFVMRFDGKNVLYDLANGGGKSVLLLLLLQNLIPNCTLDEKQPVEKLFRGDNGSTVIHSLVEWKLDDHLVQDDYRYMLTGFCARKAREDEEDNAGRDAASIEYFNYCIFYRHYNDNDIVNLPLSDGKQRITYPGLKNYLKNLSHQDYSLKVQVFERKGEYQRFISRYGLYESEWEIIRGINKTEGHVRAYFENNYRTTRKVVENLLIEEIIHKAFLNRTATTEAEMSVSGQEQQMADTLYQIKDQLAELTRRQEDLKNFDAQQEILNALGDRIHTLDDMYREEAGFELEMAKTYQTALLGSRTAARDLSVAQKEYEHVKAQLAELTRKLETVRIQSGKKELAGLESLSASYAKEMEGLRHNLAVVRDELNLRESMNDYLDYLEEQQKHQAVSQAIHHAQSDDENLYTLLASYADLWHDRLEKRLKAISDQVLGLKQKIRVSEATLSQTASEERELDKLQAVLEHRISEAKAQENAKTAEFAALRDEAGILVVEDVSCLLRKAQIEEEKQAMLLEGLKEKALEDRKKAETLRQRSLDIRPEEAGLDLRIEALARFMKEDEVMKARIKKLCEVYHVDDENALGRQIFLRYRKNVYETEEKRQRLTEIGKHLEQMGTGSLLMSSQETRRLMNYIRSVHGTSCMYGGDYLQSVDMKEREALLARLPFLPYAIILSEGFMKVAGDTVLAGKDFGDHVIPVIGLETVVSDREPCDGSHICFAGKGKNCYLDPQCHEHMLLQLEEERREITASLARMNDQIETYEQDLEDVHTYEHVYDAHREENRTEHEKLERQRKSLIQESDQIQKTLKAMDKDAEDREKQMDGAEESLKAIRSRMETLSKLQEIHNELEAIDQNKKADCRELEEIRRKIAYDAEKQELLVKENRQMEEQCRSLIAESHSLNQDWMEGWQIYAGRSEGMQDPAMASMSDDELRSAFEGARQAYEKEHFDLDDKRQLIDSLSRSMQRLAKSIADRNLRMETLEKMHLEGKLSASAPDECDSLRIRMDEVQEKIEDCENRIRLIEAERNQLCGSVNQAVTVVEEKYGSLKEVDLHDQTYEDYMQSVTRLMDETAVKITEADRHVRKLTKDSYYLDGLKQDLERMLRLYKVSPDLTSQTFGPEVNLKRKYDELTSLHEQLQKQHYTKREAFDKDRAKAIDALNALGVQGLAQEIRERVTLPENAQAAAEILTGIEETVQLIGIEKRRTEKNMTDLISVKETFANQCLQICQNIRTELDKLARMSVIRLDGERVQMLGLSIPYIRESFHKEYMSTYIDKIVSGLDALHTQEDKLRFIRQQLEWRRLFAVIVTDMNAIRLTLYKRERIREQSRYLKYEEAVGSTGQSQGIYIQFLIAIIHYISSINAAMAASENLKKVIFIDNPFGAAKDIYIWEPIFALLKANNVQLVVPARGATPAITGMFDVNYVLGQKLMGQGQQTIVVDYHSNIVIEDVEYVKIDYEQQVFDFI